jgi:hypothetical protein
MIVTLIRVRYFTVVLICISLMVKDVEHFFIYPLVICSSSFEKYLFRLFSHFKIELGFFLCLVDFLIYFVLLSSLYIMNTNPVLDD